MPVYYAAVLLCVWGGVGGWGWGAVQITFHLQSTESTPVHCAAHHRSKNVCCHCHPTQLTRDHLVPIYFYADLKNNLV